MSFFGPQKDVRDFRIYLHSDGLKKFSCGTFYHPLAHLNFRYFCPYITNKSKKTHFGAKMCFFGPRNDVRAFRKYLHSDGVKKLTYRTYYHPLKHLLTLDIFALILPNSPKKHILDPKCAFLDPKMML